MATSKAPKSRTKSEVYTTVASETGLSRKEVAAVFEALSKMIADEMGKKGPGVFTIPGLVKIKRIRKPATQAKTVPNPFKPGEVMTVKAKPARSVVKAQALKNLKEMAK